MRALLAPILLWLVSALAAPSEAGVFKCAGDKGGSVVYQDVPCSQGRELRNFDTDPPPLSVIPATPASPAAPPSRSRSDQPVKSRDAATAQASDGKAAERKFVRNGMNEAEVVQRIGRPDVTSGGGARKNGSRWAYLPAPGDPGTITTLTFQSGSVVDVERKLVR